MSKRIAHLTVALLSMAMFAVAGASAASASDNVEVFAQHVGPIYSGQSFQNTSIWHGSYAAIAGQSSGTAYSGVWLADSSGARVSAAAYCNVAGCAAYESWNTIAGTPWGNPVVHNHGNASPSWFGGTDSWY